MSATPHHSSSTPPRPRNTHARTHARTHTHTHTHTQKKKKKKKKKKKCKKKARLNNNCASVPFIN